MSSSNHNILGKINPFAAHVAIHVRLKLISIIVTVVGILAGGVLYVTAKDDSALHDEVVGDQVYSVAPGQYKFAYHDAENIGGKFGVFSAQLSDWFSSLWHGKQLGITLAVLALAIAAVCYFFSYVLSFQPEAREPKRSGSQENQ